MTSVTAVIVTYNRVELLSECLDAVAAQTLAPTRVVVVDNASTDATPQVLSARRGLDVLRMSRNTGGAGGFAAGIRAAIDGAPDAIWLLDDDTIPQPDALAELVAAADGYPGERPAVVASRVVWTDGRDHPMNTPRSRPAVSAADRQAADAVAAVPIRSASFVSILVNRAAVEALGLPVAAYFLWNDDFEYTTRLLRHGVGLLCRRSIVVHKTATFGSTDADPGERFFYEVRNKAWTFTRSPSLSPLEKVVYGGSTLRRWVRTLAASDDRATLVDGLRRGLRAARTPPTPTGDVLASAVPPGDGQ